MFEIKGKVRRAGLTMIVIAGMNEVSLVGSASATTTYSSIQKTKWSSCTSCAGTGGNGATTTHSQEIRVSSPSLSGASSRFSIGGSSRFANALWWKQLGANPSAHNFKYDLYFYLTDPSASQALEFDVNQSVGGHKYIFGTECSIKGSKTWQVYSAAARWVSTGIPCGMPAAFRWHHYTLQVQRTSNNKVRFVSITLDGKTHYVNRVYSPKSSSVKELNVAFQMDGCATRTGYSTWLDKVALTAW